MAEYKKLVISSSEAVSKISNLFGNLKSGIDMILEASRVSVEFAKIQASSANLALMALSAGLDEIIAEIEKLKGGTFSGIIAHPYKHGIISDYERNTGTMTLTARSALTQIQWAFDDEGDPLAPGKFNDYSGLVIVGSVPGIEQFIEILGAVGGFFSQRELMDLAAQILERWEQKEEPVKLSSGVDFFGVTMADFFPAYVNLLNKVQSFVEGIKSGIISASGTLDDLVAFIVRKLAEGEEIAQAIKDFLDKFVFEISEAGVYYKTFSPQKADSIKEELLQGMPKSWDTAKYSLVFGVFGGAGVVEYVFDLLTLD